MKNFKKIILAIFSLSLVFVPTVSFAQNMTTACAGTDGVETIICRISFILNSLIPLFITLGVLYFVWGVVTYVIKDDEEAKKSGKDRMIYGIIGLVIISGMWGIVTVVKETFDISTGNSLITNPSLFVPTPANNASGNPFCPPGGLPPNPVLSDVINYITCLIAKSVVPLIFTLAIVMFIWGVVQYVINDQEEGKKEKGRMFMIWGIIALTVMVSVWGLVSLLGGTFGVGNVIPQVYTE